MFRDRKLYVQGKVSVPYEESIDYIWTEIKTVKLSGTYSSGCLVPWETESTDYVVQL